ncbi:GGIII-like transmembrane region-containing protein, partial [Sphingobium sp. CCH11-B1]|uniref:GGIII-like transmembrane region-containing protein n=1 Tax=Sphingobium sp. CCH11-B1 TaxID=1768781 RepID=UPI0012E3DEC2
MTANNDAMLWGIGGGALLLIGIAGAALSRRRRRDDADAVLAEPAVAAQPVAALAATAPAAP